MIQYILQIPLVKIYWQVSIKPYSITIVIQYDLSHNLDGTKTYPELYLTAFDISNNNQKLDNNNNCLSRDDLYEADLTCPMYVAMWIYYMNGL